MSANESGTRDGFRKRNLQQWGTLLKETFPVAMPRSSIWEDTQGILRVLNKLASVEDLSHAFIPSGGGQDLHEACESTEPDCIEFRLGSQTYIIRPECLTFESFHDELEWAYFRLEADELEPSGVYDRVDGIRETLTELESGHYVDISVWEQGYFDYDERGETVPLSPDARRVHRYFEGAFVFFAKGSTYNQIPDTYDARHNEMTSSGFRECIAETLRLLQEKAKS